ncbi:MAG: inositol monophosphatase, partial [Ramlibacter sp.]
SLLVTEAGGLIGNFTGEADFMEQKECVAGNPKIYGQLVAILGKYSKFASVAEKTALRQATAELVPPETRPSSATAQLPPEVAPSATVGDPET